MIPASLSDRVWPAHHLIGGYEIVAAARQTDSGVLYRAWDRALSRPVLLEEFLPAALALRGEDGLIRPALPAAAALLERARRSFEEEARLLARSDHPALARVLHVVEAHGTLFRVMPGYTGPTLDELMARDEAPQDERMLRRLLEDVLGALDAWHSIAGPHGGVRPAQILCLDNGHALLLGPDAVSLTPLGSGGWPGPPQPMVTASRVAGDPDAEQGIAEDLQALARVVRACMLHGAPVEPGYSLRAEFARRASDDDPRAPHYSAALLQTLDAALSADRQTRPQSAAQMSQWLQATGLPAVPGQPEAPDSASATTAHHAGSAPAPHTAPAQPAVAASAPTPATMSPELPESAELEVDPITSALIRSVVDAIPDRPGGPNRPVRKTTPQPPRRPSAAPSEPLLHDTPEGAVPGARERAAVPPHLQRIVPPRRQRLLGSVLALMAVLLIGGSLAWWVQSEAGPDGDAERYGDAAVSTTQSSGTVPGDASSRALRAPGAGQDPSGTPAPSGAMAPSAPVGATAPGHDPASSALPSAPAAEPPPQPLAPAAEAIPTSPTAADRPAPAAPPREFREPLPGPPKAAAAPAARPSPPTAATQGTPRQQCGSRTQFSLYRCMQQQCAQPRWRSHPQCAALREFDSVPG